MGLLGTIATFGVGYLAGARTAPKAKEQLSGAAGQLATRAKGMLPRSSSMAGTSGSADGMLDVRSIREVMTAAPETVRRSASLQEAARVMARDDIGNVIVESDDGTIAGILTDRDLAIRATAEGMDPSSTTVEQVYSAGVATLAPTDTVHDAMQRMREHDVRRLPVVESGTAIGIVSLGDISVETDPSSLLADISTATPDR
jgi:signal-transduction protein with cAMP-binding, CBS, and nucleotidyltransferase domain